jgi:hypothetical protein
LDCIGALIDWLIIYMPFEIFGYKYQVSLIGGRNVSVEAYACYQVILLQIIFIQYFRNTKVHVIYSYSVLFLITLIGIALIFDSESNIGVD